MVRVIVWATLALFLTSCATTPDPKVCAAVGAALGGGGGAYAGRETPGHDGDEIAGYGAAGIVVGGAAGWALCKVLAKEEEPEREPAPPPPPPPAPEPRAEPAPPPPPDPCDQVIRLRGVHFDFDKSAIRPDAAVILEEASSLLEEAMRECPSRRVSIEGHTDAIGTDAYNQALSERRARSVYDYLVAHGVSASKLSTRGYGESRPVASNETRQGRAMNRRVELNLVQ